MSFFMPSTRMMLRSTICRFWSASVVRRMLR